MLGSKYPKLPEPKVVEIGRSPAVVAEAGTTARPVTPETVTRIAHQQRVRRAVGDVGDLHRQRRWSEHQQQDQGDESC